MDAVNPPVVVPLLVVGCCAFGSILLVFQSGRAGDSLDYALLDFFGPDGTCCVTCLAGVVGCSFIGVCVTSAYESFLDWLSSPETVELRSTVR